MKFSFVILPVFHSFSLQVFALKQLLAMQDQVGGKW
jgi:hypothetical protein